MQEQTQKAASLFLENHHLVLSVAFQNAPLFEMAEDIAQDAFMEFVNHADRWDLETDVQPLLITITKKISLRYWVENKKKMPDKLAELFEKLRLYAAQEEEDYFVKPRLHALSVCMEKLSPKNRRLLDLHYTDRRSMSEIGKIYDSTTNAICLAVFRIRKTLKTCIESIMKTPSELSD